MDPQNFGTYPKYGWFLKHSSLNILDLNFFRQVLQKVIQFKMLKKQTKRKIIEDKIRRRKEQTPSRLSEIMSGHPHRPPRCVPFPSARPLQTSQEEISEPSVKNSNELQVDKNHFFDMSSRASSQFEPLIPDFSLSSSGTGHEITPPGGILAIRTYRDPKFRFRRWTRVAYLD